MSVCVVKYHHLCEPCRAHCHSIPNGNPEHSAVELNDLCSLCVKTLKNSYVGVVSARHDWGLLEAVTAASPWCREHHTLEYLRERKAERE